jgi:hypothetical protein
MFRPLCLLALLPFLPLLLLPFASSFIPPTLVFPPSSLAAALAAEAEIDDEELLADPMFLPDAPASPREEELVMKARRYLYMNQGIDAPDMLADEFRFMGPVVGGEQGLGRDEYLQAVGGFDIRTAFPDLSPGFHHFRVDPFEPDRVWFTSRASGTHLGQFLYAKPTGIKFETPPQACSLLFDESGRVKKYT